MKAGAKHFPFLGKREQLLTPAKRDKAVRLQQSPHHNNGLTLKKARLEKNIHGFMVSTNCIKINTANTWGKKVIQTTAKCN